MSGILKTPSDAEKPEGLWGTILATTPVVLTVLATLFAGLSQSEMTKSMYYRSLASQQQSKATDQWGFFQAKRIRGTTLETTVELLRSMAKADATDHNTLQSTVSRLHESPQRDQVLKLLDDEQMRVLWPNRTGMTIIVAGSMTRPSGTLGELTEAIARRESESATVALVAKLSHSEIDAAIAQAEDEAAVFDRASDQVSKSLEKLRSAVAQLPLAADNDDVQRMSAGIRAAAWDFDSRRYRQEANFNRHVAELYEVKIRRTGLESDRHRNRSQKFFYSMLIAQAGVTVASLALAKRKRSYLWLFAALAGIAALGFSGYVYWSE